jgi:hypothetical protein
MATFLQWAAAFGSLLFLFLRILYEHYSTDVRKDIREIKKELKKVKDEIKDIRY